MVGLKKKKDLPVSKPYAAWIQCGIYVVLSCHRSQIMLIDVDKRIFKKQTKLENSHFYEREISRKMTFGLHYANQFLERYEWTTAGVTQFALCHE